jgi:hypothetical protein
VSFSESICDFVGIQGNHAGRVCVRKRKLKDLAVVVLVLEGAWKFEFHAKPGAGKNEGSFISRWLPVPLYDSALFQVSKSTLEGRASNENISNPSTPLRSFSLALEDPGSVFFTLSMLVVPDLLSSRMKGDEVKAAVGENL